MYSVEDYKQFIYESLVEKGIVDKCGKPKYFSRKTMVTMDRFREETKDLDHERALYIDNEGNILWEKEGNKNSVNLDMQEAWNLSDPHETEWHPSKGVGYGMINIEHNHPTIDGFEAFPPVLSMGDTAKMLSYANDGYLFRSITAEGNGKRMSIVRKPDFEAETSMHHGNFDRDKYESAREHLDKSIDKYIGMYGDKLSEFARMDRDKLFGLIGSGQFSQEFSREDRALLSQHCIDEIGSLKSLLESDGVIKEFDECGLSIYLEE